MSRNAEGKAGKLIAELRGKLPEDLDKELTGLYREQFNLRMQRGSGQDVKPHDFKRVRRQIARIKTIQNQQASANAEASVGAGA